jgi:hypothetical protein
LIASNPDSSSCPRNIFLIKCSNDLFQETPLGLPLLDENRAYRGAKAANRKPF